MDMPIVNGVTLAVFAFAAIAAYFIGKRTGYERGRAAEEKYQETRPGLKRAWFNMYYFHLKFRHVIHRKPCIPDDRTKMLRRNLVREEFREFMVAWEDNDLVEIADAIADLIYVLIGTAVSYGIYLPPIWRAVHRSNMKKSPKKRWDGKSVKGPDWKPPDIAELLREQGAEI